MLPLHTLMVAAIGCVAVAGLTRAISVLATLAESLTTRELALWGLLDLLFLGAFGAGAVCFILWLYRARRNLALLPDAQPRWAVAWSVGVWFIPIANLVLAGLVVVDVARESAHSSDHALRQRLTTLARLWWAVSAFTALIHVRMSDPMTPPNDQTIWATAILLLAGAGLCIALLRDVSTVQRQRLTQDEAVVGQFTR
jgi:cytochrome c-type biogenesis protein CcmH/NrfF